jgi:hydroxyacylglutathione hydrolase
MARLMFLDLFDRNPFGTNCWILGTEGSDDAVVVDPGYDAEGIRSLLARSGRRPVAALLTHAHLDHASAAGEFAGEEIPVFVHPGDAVAYDDLDRWNPGFENPLTSVKDLRTIEDGEALPLAGLSFLVHHTPGHTPGHCSFEVETTLAGGDLVFAGTIGRSDFPNSSPADMERSLRWFLTLDDAVEVLPGHGERTTVGRERAANPYLVRLA